MTKLVVLLTAKPMICGRQEVTSDNVDTFGNKIETERVKDS